MKNLQYATILATIKEGAIITDNTLMRFLCAVL